MYLATIFVSIVIFLLFQVIRKVQSSADASLAIPFVTKNYWPIVGHTVSISKDISKFIRECKRLYGSRFYVKLFSQRIIFILDPSDWPYVLRNPNVTLPTEDMSVSIFGMSRKFFEDKSAISEMHRYFKQYLENNSALDPLVEQFMKFVRQTMVVDRKKISDGTWQYCGLLELCHRMIFEASGRTLFGELNPLSVENAFIEFDNQFHYFAASLPKFVYSLFFRRALRAREEMSTFFTKHTHAPNESELIYRRTNRLGDVSGSTPNDAGAAQMAIFWASVGNTIPGTFWFLYYILRNQNALNKIREEIQTHLPVFSLSDENPPNITLWTWKDVSKCVYLDSALNEMLRLQATPMVSKKCIQDTEISLSDGKLVSLRAGDMVALYPEVTHKDATYFPEPETFIFDRFVGKNGDTIRGFLPFGSGKSICPGRHFAKNEIKICTALILHYIDYEFLDKNSHVEWKKFRVGFGIAPPTHDLPIRYRYRPE